MLHWGIEEGKTFMYDYLMQQLHFIETLAIISMYICLCISSVMNNLSQNDKSLQLIFLCISYG